MSKAVINNEIIILRKFVEQARVHIIKKLIRDVTKYRKKKGTDAQKAKNERKSKRLAAEILSIKKVKKDEVTKHILTNNLSLKEVLENQMSTPLNRALTRIAHHKIFSKKIDEFKSKYPNYMEFIGPSRKKKAISEWKEKKVKSKERIGKMIETKGGEKPEMLHSDNFENKFKSVRERNDSFTNTEDNSKEVNDNEDLNEKETNCVDKKYNESSTDLQINSSAISDKRKKRKIDLTRNNDPKIISKQAIVTKLTDILQEDTSSKNRHKEIISESSNSNIVEKEVDSFFLTDNEQMYLSIAVPKDKASNIQDDFIDNAEWSCKKKKISRQQNNFFGKDAKFKKNDSEFVLQWEDKKLYKKQNNTNKFGLDNKRKFESANCRSNSEKAKFVKNEKTTVLDSTSVEHLHPSWQARKKEQEMLKKGFQGKKIIFGDDM